MAAGVSVLRRMLIWRRITAERSAAGLAGTQMHPRIAGFDTFIANVLMGSTYFFQTGQVFADGLFEHMGNEVRMT